MSIRDSVTILCPAGWRLSIRGMRVFTECWLRCHDDKQKRGGEEKIQAKKKEDRKYQLRPSVGMVMGCMLGIFLTVQSPIYCINYFITFGRHLASETADQLAVFVNQKLFKIPINLSGKIRVLLTG